MNDADFGRWVLAWSPSGRAYLGDPGAANTIVSMQRELAKTGSLTLTLCPAFELHSQLVVAQAGQASALEVFGPIFGDLKAAGAKLHLRVDHVLFVGEQTAEMQSVVRGRLEILLRATSGIVMPFTRPVGAGNGAR